MTTLLHTICLEPLRWKPEKVYRPLLDLIPSIAAAGFRELEVFEPHLEKAADESRLLAELRGKGLDPVILSSYLRPSPYENDEAAFARKSEVLLSRVKAGGFRKVRLFPGSGPQEVALREVARQTAPRIHHLAAEAPEVEWILETHSKTVADDWSLMLEFLEWIGQPNVKLLFQPTIFQREPAGEQWKLQKGSVAHLHLQNSHADGTPAFLSEGIVDWKPVLQETKAEASIEFVPSGICPVEDFDLETVLEEAQRTREWVQHVRKG